jgi:CRISPR/Cas system-associated exonuclease Cas4 (RecB family)
MRLPENFQFSQGSLQDYVDCPRRFQLKYIQQLSWPAVDVEPALENEIYLQLGAAFHRMVQQYLLGVPAEKLMLQASQDVQLARWWENFIQDVGKRINRKVGNYDPEITLSAPIGDFRLVGKYDLLIKADHKFTIYDWKTSRKHPKREWLALNLQTRVYPFLLAQAGMYLNKGKLIAPDQIEMIYWFANFPTAPLRFPYSQAQFREDETYIAGLIEEIKLISEEPAPLTENEKRCRYCVYRSLCNRGIEAGPMEEFESEVTEDLLNFDLDFEQIAEVEF